jgi:hypothetical protein
MPAPNPYYLARVKMPTSGDRSSSVSNNLALLFASETDPVSADFAAAATALEGLYNNGAFEYAISSVISTEVSRVANACSVEFYNVTGALGVGEAMGSPVAIVDWTMGPNSGGAGNQSLPAQIASVLSFRTTYGSDVEFGVHTRPRADDRGRIYLGPLSGKVLGTDGDTPPRCVFTSDWLSVISQELSLLITNLNAANWQLMVWSRKEAAMKVVDEKSADLVPDTQRRRADNRGLLVWAPI